MSRTYRRKNDNHGEKWEIGTFCRDHTLLGWHWKPYPPGSVEYKRGLARYHSDVGTTPCKEPGPSWWRNLTTERKQRREGVRQLNKFINNPDYEVILNAKDPLDYWT